ncbi:MAG: helix-turn-helix domain-containing protein [Thermoguttaceae bacterium]
MTDTTSIRTKLTPPELAARWGKKASTIIAWIRAGRLPAIDTSMGCKRPRFLIDEADIAVFESRQRVQPPPAHASRCKQKKTKKEPTGWVSYSQTILEKASREHDR